MLIDSWRPLAVRIARRIVLACGTVIPGDELESAAMWGLFQAIERFDPEKGAKFGTYLGFKVRSAVLDHIRFETHRADRSKVRFHLLGTLWDDMEAPSTPLAADHQELAEMALCSLKPMLREVIRLRFYEEKTCQEIGARMGFSEGMISQLLRTALSQMREVLTKHGLRKEDVA